MSAATKKIDDFVFDPVKDRKKEADLAHVVDAELPPAVQLAKSGKLHEGLELLLGLEKQTRTVADLPSSQRVLVQIVQLCFEAKEWALLNEYLALLMKKRGQLKQAMTKLVQEAMTYVDQIDNLEIKLKLIDTLRELTEGKIYVEIERARLTRKLAKIKEDEGKIAEAADIMQELQVETFGSMERREKTEFILEQMRLLLGKGDYVRTLAVSKNISPRYFDADKEKVQDLKIRYYQLLIQYGDHEAKYLDVSKYYYQIYNTKAITDGEGPWKQDSLPLVLRAVILYVIFAVYNNEQSDLLNRMSLDKNLEKIPKTQSLLKKFTTQELIYWKEIEQDFKDEVFSNVLIKSDYTSKLWTILQERVVEHNIRVVAKYYTRISIKRLSQLVNLTEKETEAILSKIIVSKAVQGLIDRPDGFVTFAPPQDPNSILNTWSNDLGNLLQLVERTTHLITKEEMVHNIIKA